MRLKCFMVVVMVCGAVGLLRAQKQIQLLATVASTNGEPLATIEAKDVSITENGAPATIVKIEGFNRVSKVQVLVDNGVGVPSESIGDLRKGLAGLLEALPANVEVAVITTSPQPRFVERGTTDRAKLIKAVDLIAPDSGSGRFVESLAEATQRVEKDVNSVQTIITIGTTAGDLNVRDADIKRIMERTGGGRLRIYTVLLAGRIGTTGGGVAQESVGEAAAKNTGGRFERINVASRLTTLLPEIGADAAKTLGPATRQFRFTVDRPGGASGALGTLRMSATGFLVMSVIVESR